MLETEQSSKGTELASTKSSGECFRDILRNRWDGRLDEGVELPVTVYRQEPEKHAPRTASLSPLEDKLASLLGIPRDKFEPA